MQVPKALLPLLLAFGVWSCAQSPKTTSTTASTTHTSTTKRESVHSVAQAESGDDEIDPNKNAGPRVNATKTTTTTTSSAAHY